MQDNKSNSTANAWWAAVKEADIEAVSRLIQQDRDLLELRDLDDVDPWEQANKWEPTALLKVCGSKKQGKDQDELVCVLLDEGANIKASDAFWKATPLYWNG
uniref:Ankyrin repeat domain-containing protein n=1 Tax=Fibrocapsa japonica TaxID=94617 RepID=A0A7S2XW46_9STRA|mmetsp:Transcript_18041/g.26264  ORF Transcript_18041/g.26264 Transcript_18041/m.26264 type:complete len:102 (+) Transcript_18041:184-489(+)|eukprot:CAMPEP_0113934502 /NCGR_PEP_ID=MMETSP1339-20121228/1828_1 /TAXON_ID=94617 /ORGANISM="Fibrocapsa japonica" /LENGTH=101 /DNA_ID=CAMNT_0000936339 /DNA_START=163 /DNA_END=468 /DNA_ORIENTATION=- /assembly_acc=CAM_ASM_000762